MEPVAPVASPSARVPEPDPEPDPARAGRLGGGCGRLVGCLGFGWIVVAGLVAPVRGDAVPGLERVRQSGRLVYGSDAEGGGPYAYPDPERPSRVIGFEVELMRLLCGGLGPEPVLYQGQWDALLPTLAAGHVDAVVNGYEQTPARLADYAATRPYYIYQLQLLARPGSPIGSFDDLRRPKVGGGHWTLAVLGGSAAETYANEHGGQTISVQYFNGATDCLMAVKNGQADATLQDLPAARFYGRTAEYREALRFAGPPVGHGYYVMYFRRSDAALRDAIDAEIGRVVRTGELRTIYEKYGIWTDAQLELADLGPPTESPETTARQESLRGPALLVRYGPTLLASAAMTVFLAVTAMPIAIALGLAIALGRLYGPKFLRPPLAIYVEVIRGTPLMLQLFVLFFLLPAAGLELPALVAAIGGLALNYSAYESEIYRAGLQAIPPGQMEAALALGMTRSMALRRVVVPQAVRLVIPPVTNDFIALFKDTSVCSVISIVELTKRYAILANSTGGVVEFAVATAALYLAMGLPLSYLSRTVEAKLGAEGPRGGIA